MPKVKKESKKPELNPADFADYGDFMRAKRGEEVPVEPVEEAPSEEVKEE